MGAQLRFLHYVSVPARGLSGGLVTYWHQHVQLSVLCQSPNLIDCKVGINGSSSLYFSFVYGHPNQASHSQVSERIERIGIGRRNEAWMLFGDFKEILENHEKTGGRERRVISFQDIWNMVRNNNILDVKSI